MYRLNDKAKELNLYSPVSERFRIHLDANESFLTLPDTVMSRITKAIQELPLNRYPDPTAEEACQAFSRLYGVERGCVVAGNGSDELISIIFNVFLQKDEAFATIEPDFSMYAFYGQLSEGRHVSIKKEKDFTIDIDNTIKTCNNEAVKLLIFSNPCNPTSIGITAAAAARLISGVEALVVLDEAYMDFWEESLLPRFEAFDNLIILKTCSKAFGMAGIRLGFAVAQQPLAEALMAAKSPYNVNAVTQCAGSIVMEEKDLQAKALGTILASKAQLEKELRVMAEKSGSFTLLQGHTNFLALEMENPEAFYNYLKNAGIAVRFTAGFIRVTCGTQEENREFLQYAENYFLGDA